MCARPTTRRQPDGHGDWGMNKVLLACAAIAAAFPVAGCNMSERLAEAAANRCASYGFSPGTPEFAQCQMNVDQANRQMLAGYMGMQMQANQQNAILQQQNMLAEQRALSAAAEAAHSTPPPAPAPTNCTTTYVENQAYMHCQ